MTKISEKQQRVWGNFIRFFTVISKVNLTLKEQEFIIWHYHNNMTYKQIRKMTGWKVSRQYIHQVVRQGIMKLRIKLTEHKSEYIL